MKKIESILVVLIVAYLGFYLYKNNDKVIDFGVKNFTNYFTNDTKVSKPSGNVYTQNYTFNYVWKTDNFKPKNKQDLLNIIYTILNSGISNFTFYCDREYTSCIDDISDVSNNKTTLSIINNLVSPFNSYNKLYISSNKLGAVTITTEKLYSDGEINQINQKFDLIIGEIIKDNMTDEEKIKAMHDYLINHAVYDEERAQKIKAGNDESPVYQSHKATGPMIQGVTLCSGYSDAIKIYLDRLNIPNYKISNMDHIWNLVKINDKWLHLDLTWDDPVTPNKQNVLMHKYFLIDTPKLMELDPTGHNFSEIYYSETK